MKPALVPICQGDLQRPQPSYEAKRFPQECREVSEGQKVK